MRTSTQNEPIFTTDTNQQETKTSFTNSKPPTPSPSKPAKSSMDAMDASLNKRSTGYSKSNTRLPPLPYAVDLGMLEEGRAGVRGDSPYRSPSYAGTPRATQFTPKTPLITSPGPAGGGDNGGVGDQVSKNHIHESSNQNHRPFKPKSFVEWLVFLILLGCLIASLKVQPFQRSVLWGMKLWKWCLLLMIIFCGLFYTKWIMHLMVFLIERNFMLKKNVLYFVHGLKHSVQFFVWLGIVLFTWILLFSKEVDHSSDICNKLLNNVTWTLVSMLIGSFLWFLKTLLLKVLASKFHVKTFFDRIEETIKLLYFLQSLSDPPLIGEDEKLGREPRSVQLSLRTGSNIGKTRQLIDMSKIHEMKREKVHAWNLKVIYNELMNKGLSTISNDLDEIMETIEGEKEEEEQKRQAKRAANSIFRNVSQDQEFIKYEDLTKFMIKEEVHHFLSLFEGATESRKIDKTAWIDWVVKVYQERTALALALIDMKTAVRELDKVLTGILVVITIVIWLLLTEIASTKVLLILSTQLLALGFLFKSTCKTIFESIIFVFVIHPFDVGDRCVVDGVTMLVEEMKILSTVFLKLNFEKVYYPNSILARKPISNYQRSNEMGDTVNFTIDFTTPLEKIGVLKEEIKTYLLENPTRWQENHSVIVNEIENLNQIKMSLNVNYTINYQDFPEKNKRRTDLILKMKTIFEKLEIKYWLLPQKIHLVDKVKEA